MRISERRVDVLCIATRFICRPPQQVVQQPLHTDALRKRRCLSTREDARTQDAGAPILEPKHAFPLQHHRPLVVGPVRVPTDLEPACGEPVINQLDQHHVACVVRVVRLQVVLQKEQGVYLPCP